MTQYYSWSLDEEQFHGEYASREEAIGEALEYAANDYEPGSAITVYTGVIASAVSFLLKAKNFGELAVEQAECYLGDYIGSDDYIFEISNNKVKELNEIIVDYLCKEADFNRYGVKDVQEHQEVLE